MLQNNKADKQGTLVLTLYQLMKYGKEINRL